MAAPSTPFGSLSVALAQAISYLTRSLIVHYSATTIIKLQLALEANLTAQFEPSWIPTEPLRGSGRRCLTLSSSRVPPRAIYNACRTANVQWSHWITLLGGVEFDLFIDPGCISIRFGDWESGKASKFFTIWHEEVEPQTKSLPPQNSKTLAQQLLENDQDEDEQLFALIADEVREPSWLTPILTQFPTIPSPLRSLSPASIASSHSRSSSSSSSSGFTFFSEDSMDSYSSATTVSVSSHSPPFPGEKPQYKVSRRERARQARVFVDSSKKEVTNYDGGKTTVLTGGVMLGGANVSQKAQTVFHQKAVSPSSSSSWRTVRV
ncbi:hypothetical protein BKA93DRAFT_733666 [Sparassis latifolia]